MKAKVVSIGRARGIRLPKELLAHCKLNDEIDVQFNGSGLLLQTSSRPRRGWNAAFARMRRRGDDRLLDISFEVPPSSWDDREWKW